MKIKIDLDFCVIQSIYKTGFRNLIFVTYRGSNRIEENLCLETEYENLKYIMDKYGFKEIEYCTFESSNNYNMHIEEVKMKISENGLRYSKTLEFILSKEINDYHQEIKLLQKNNQKTNLETVDKMLINVEKFRLNTKYKVPEVGEKITLYFYLFLKCNFISDKDCVLDLVGDMDSKQDNNNKNFLQIAKSDFVRIDCDIPNVISLQSKKTYSDFFNEINFLHKGNFKFSKPAFNHEGDMVTSTKEFVYNIMEIKKNINPNTRILVDVNLNKFYDEMLDSSKKIKKELSVEQKRLILLETLIPEIVKLKNKFNEKMLTHANIDEFEKAGNIKKDINFLDNKIKIIDAMEEKNITKQEYLKTFCLNS